jgi:hypothetical protein
MDSGPNYQKRLRMLAGLPNLRSSRSKKVPFKFWVRTTTKQQPQVYFQMGKLCQENSHRSVVEQEKMLSLLFNDASCLLTLGWFLLSIICSMDLTKVRKSMNIKMDKSQTLLCLILLVML